MPSASQNTDAMTFPADGTDHGNFSDHPRNFYQPAKSCAEIFTLLLYDTDQFGPDTQVSVSTGKCNLLGQLS